MQEIFLHIRIEGYGGCVRNIPAHQDRGLWRMCRKYSCTCVCECYGEVCKNVPAPMLMRNKHSCTREWYGGVRVVWRSESGMEE